MSPIEDPSSDPEVTRNDRFYHEGGKLMASPPSGEEIVISGDDNHYIHFIFLPSRLPNLVDCPIYAAAICPGAK